MVPICQSSSYFGGTQSTCVSSIMRARENIAHDYAGQRRKNALIMTLGKKFPRARAQTELIFFRLRLLNCSKVQLGVRITNKSFVHEICRC